MCALPPPALRRLRQGFGAVGWWPAAVPLAGGGLPVSALAAGADMPPALSGPQASALACALLGALALRWWTRRRDGPAGLLAGAVAMVGVLHGLHDTAGSVAAAAWAQASTAWLLALAGLFSWHLCGFLHVFARRALLAYAGAASVAALPVWPWSGPLPALLHLGVAGALALRISLHAWRSGKPEPLAAAAAAWATLALGLHDLRPLMEPDPAAAGRLMVYAPLLWSAVFLYAMQRRCLAALADNERVRAGPAGLPEAPPSWREAERLQAVLRERQRLMRDLHDGAGSALMSALVLVEQGQLGPRAVADLLRECMDDIRLVIDSMEPVDHDLVALLASLRYRLGRRMELAGVRLAWQVQDVPALTWMDAGAALQILRIVQESLANVLKHAQAHSVVLGVAAYQEGERRWVRVTIADDGCGFDLARLEENPPGGGRGLQNLRSRARALRGRLAIGSRPGGTEITLDLPVHAGPQGEEGPPLDAACGQLPPKEAEPADRSSRLRGVCWTVPGICQAVPVVLTERHE